MTNTVKDAEDTNFEFTTFEVSRRHMAINGQMALVEQINGINAQSNDMMDSIKGCPTTCSVYQRNGVDANGLVIWNQIYIGNQ